MQVMVIDGDTASLERLGQYVRHAGCTPALFVDPEAALSVLTPEVNVILADTATRGLEPATFAERVATMVGGGPPRPLFIVGKLPDGQAPTLGPSRVLGWLVKPVVPADLRRVLRFLAATRKTCPGHVAPLCAHRWRAVATNGGSAACGALVCQTPRYPDCEHYAVGCGRRLQDWISATAGGIRWSSVEPLPAPIARSWLREAQTAC